MIFIEFILFVGWLSLLSGFVWMIGLGILSSIFHAPNLAIGYWQSVLVAFIVNLLLGGFIRSNK